MTEEIKKQTLGELLDEEHEINKALVLSEGEILPDLESAKALNDESLKLKVDQYAYQIKRFDMEAEFRKAEAAREKHIQKVCENIAERMRTSLKRFMLVHDKKELFGNRDGFMLHDASMPSVELKEGVSLESIPENFVRTKVVTELDKQTVIALYKGGNDVVKQELSEYFDFKVSKVLKPKPNTEPKKLTKGTRTK